MASGASHNEMIMAAMIAMRLLFVLPVAGQAEERNTIRFDFEIGDLQGWRVVEGEFSKLLGDREFEFHNERKYTNQGTYYLTTLERADNERPDDSQTGAVESPVFVLNGPSASLLVGGRVPREHVCRPVHVGSQRGPSVPRGQQPGNAAFGIDPLEVADQQHAKIHARRDARTPQLRSVERFATFFHEGVEPFYLRDRNAAIHMQGPHHQLLTHTHKGHWG